jgi:hypothetical protein
MKKIIVKICKSVQYKNIYYNNKIIFQIKHKVYDLKMNHYKMNKSRILVVLYINKNEIISIYSNRLLSKIYKIIL